MKRIFGASLILLISLFAGLAPTQNASAQSTNNFRITQYNIQYELSRDSEGRSVLKTTETITAQFPIYNQNHGLERALPSNYDGHSTSLKLIEATNTDGNTQHSTSTENGVMTLRIGDPDEYVHGMQTYRIVYEQRDVTKFFENTNRDEWYWDTNGTEWRVPIDELTVVVAIDRSLLDAREGEPACYQGATRSTDTCELLPGTTSGTYTVTVNSLAAGENVTLAIGFKPETFAAYSMPWWQVALSIWATLQFIAIPFAVLATIIASVVYARRSNRSSETHTIVTEYIPPKDASVIVAAQVTGTTAGSVFTAQLIDLAVRRFISIVETKAKTFWKPAEYDIVIASDLTPLFAEEKEIISDMFGKLPQKGERLALSTLKNNMSYSKRTLDNDKKLTQLIENTYGIRQKVPVQTKKFYLWAKIIGIIALPLISIPLGIAAGIIALLGYSLVPLSDKGLAIRRYVLGLDKYVKASEVERIKFLQSPETVDKIGYTVDANNSGELVKLYERTLPYAILFGREKEWAKRLGEFYQQANNSPDWYTGTTAFNAAVFASTLSSFSQASMYSSGASSSSGGSSGGGSSGGGGGGGGGGGW